MVAGQQVECRRAVIAGAARDQDTRSRVARLSGGERACRGYRETYRLVHLPR